MEGRDEGKEGKIVKGKGSWEIKAGGKKRKEKEEDN